MQGSRHWGWVYHPLVAPGLALRLPEPQPPVPLAEYLESVGGGEDIESRSQEELAELKARRHELRTQSVALTDKIVADAKEMTAATNASSDAITPEQAEILVRILDERVENASQLLRFYRKAQFNFASLRSKLLKGLGHRPGLASIRQSLNESVAHAADDIRRQREVVVAYQDLRKAIISLRERSSAARQPMPRLSNELLWSQYIDRLGRQPLTRRHAKRIARVWEVLKSSVGELSTPHAGPDVDGLYFEMLWERGPHQVLVTVNADESVEWLYRAKDSDSFASGDLNESPEPLVERLRLLVGS